MAKCRDAIGNERASVAALERFHGCMAAGNYHLIFNKVCAVDPASGLGQAITPAALRRPDCWFYGSPDWP